MALIYSSFSTLNDQAIAEFRRQLPDVDPTIFGGFASPFLTSASALAYSISLTVRDLEKELFPQTAEGEFLDLWGGYENLERNVATAADGNISIGGTVGVNIPIGTAFSGSTGVSYENTAVSTVQNISQSISSLERVGSTVTATTSGDHSLATGLSINISGAVESDYNGTFEIAVTGRDKFTYQITTMPSTPATGTITVDGDYASVPISATTTGQDTNLSGGAVLSIDTGIANLDNVGFVQFDGIVGGADTESDALYRARILLSRSIIEGVFTADQVKLAALGVAGNTRAFVIQPSLSVCDPLPSAGFIPSAGQVAIYILRDGDVNIIPSQGVLDDTKQAIIENGKLPANSSETDVFVFAPDTVSVDFDFTSLSPDTPTMRAAVQTQIQAFFDDSVDFQEDVLEAAYLGAIQNTQDLQTGDFINSFALSAPSGNVSISDGEIAILGNVTFSI